MIVIFALVDKGWDLWGYPHITIIDFINVSKGFNPQLSLKVIINIYIHQSSMLYSELVVSYLY